MTDFHVNLVTAAGFAALQQKCSELSRSLCACQDNRASDSAATPNGAGSGGPMSRQEHLRVESLAATELAKYKQILALSNPAPEPADDGYVHLGTVCELSKNGAEPRTYVLVGKDEPTEIWTDKVAVSSVSPLGRELAGRGIGESFTVEAPAGFAEYTVMAVWVPDAPHSDQAELPLVSTVG